MNALIENARNVVFDVGQVLLRFETPRPFHHPDDNDLILSCSPELFDSLREGARGMGTWEVAHRRGYHFRGGLRPQGMRGYRRA